MRFRSSGGSTRLYANRADMRTIVGVGPGHDLAATDTTANGYIPKLSGCGRPDPMML